MVLIRGSRHPGPRARAHTRNVMAMAFSPSGQLTSSGADDDIQFWWAFGEPNGAVVKANQQYGRRFVFSSTGKMFSAGQAGTGGFWSNRGAAIRHLARELKTSSLTISPKALSGNNYINFWVRAYSSNRHETFLSEVGVQPSADRKP